MLPDRIETGTYAMAVAMTGGDVLLENARPDLLRVGARRAGADRRRGHRDERAASASAATATASQPVDVTTEPFPGFPTDLQAQFMALMTRAERHLAHQRDDLREPLHARAGAGAPRRPHPPRRRQPPIVEGVERLKGAPVMATDLRASVSLVIAGLAAEGETTINRVYHLDRGFEPLEEKLAALRRRYRADQRLIAAASGRRRNSLTRRLRRA